MPQRAHAQGASLMPASATPHQHPAGCAMGPTTVFDTRRLLNRLHTCKRAPECTRACERTTQQSSSTAESPQHAGTHAPGAARPGGSPTQCSLQARPCMHERMRMDNATRQQHCSVSPTCRDARARGCAHFGGAVVVHDAHAQHLRQHAHLHLHLGGRSGWFGSGSGYCPCKTVILPQHAYLRLTLW